MCVCVFVHVCMCVCMYMCICMYVYIYVYMYSYMYVYIYIYIYIYSYVCISDCNWTRTQNHLVRKQTLNHTVNTQYILCVCIYTFIIYTKKYLQSDWLRGV